MSAAPSFSLASEPLAEDAFLVVATGELDFTVRGLGRELAGLVEQGARRVVIDLSGLSFLDTTTLDALLAFRTSIQESGGQVALVVGEGETHRFFELTGLEQVFSIYVERADAFRALGLDGP
jgi:anti-anti-sigma factor